MAKKQAKQVLASLTEIGHNELKKRGTFMPPGFAKFTLKHKAARKARKGFNPFTKEPCVFKAKPACKVVRAPRLLDLVLRGFLQFFISFIWEIWIFSLFYSGLGAYVHT